MVNYTLTHGDTQDEHVGHSPENWSTRVNLDFVWGLGVGVINYDEQLSGAIFWLCVL